MKRTSKYQMTYFEEGDLTIPTVETQRWATVDSQLYGLFRILGNGIISGWDLAVGVDDLSVVVSAGMGHVNYVAVQSSLAATIISITPSTRNYIYANLTESSFWSQNVNFLALVHKDTSGKLVYLGYVDVSPTAITSINVDGRNEIGYVDSIRELISQHEHIGGTGNPSPINLASQVQGDLNVNNIAPLDASVISTGVFDADRIPNLDHITKLINNGVLTHAQLDAFVSSLTNENASLMGDIATTNMLKMNLALKHSHTDIDSDFLNEIALIPGVSPNAYIDSVNSTASWDIVEGTIYAYPAGTPLRFFTEKFDVNYDLKSFIVTYENTIQFGISSSESSIDSESSGGSTVKFAVSAKDSTSPSDYQYVDPHKVTDISSLSSDGSIKVMIEFDGDNGEIITMGGFAFMFSSVGDPAIIG